MNASTPGWVDAVTALLVVLGALAALIGSFGLLRFGHFFERLHTPTLVATVGTWSFALATALQISFVREQVYFHALLIPAFIGLTAPITTVFLTRAAAFRARQSGAKIPGEPVG